MQFRQTWIIQRSRPEEKTLLAPRRNICKLAVGKIRFEKVYGGKKKCYLYSYKQVGLTVVHPQGATMLMRKEVLLLGCHPGHSHVNVISLLKRMSSDGGFAVV